MKFVVNISLLTCVFIAHFVCEICCNPPSLQYSESNEINPQYPNNASLTVTTSLLNAKNPLNATTNNTVAIRRRKRKRRKKKKVVNQTEHIISTIAPNINLTTYNLLNTPFRSTKRPRRRKTSPKRKIRRRKQFNKNVIYASTSRSFTNSKLESNSSKSSAVLLETKSLILPVSPSPKFSSIENKNDNIKKAKIKNTRCSKNNGGCTHLCLAEGPQKCQCLKGFRLAEDGRKCVDINECLIHIHGCQMNCTNTVGSYRCHCPRGLRLSLDSKSCEDVNECLLRNGHGFCQDRCENTYGSYKCNCNSLKGTKLGNDLHSCVDLDECLKENGDCSHICINTFGRSFCSCPEGMELSLDFKTCQSVDSPKIII